jgi:hypothetical protein
MLDHPTLFKNHGKSAENMRKHRGDIALSLHHYKREEVASKCRNINQSEDQ